MAVGPNKLLATVLTNNKFYRCHQVTAEKKIVTRKESNCGENTETDLLTYSAGLISQNTTYYL